MVANYGFWAIFLLRLIFLVRESTRHSVLLVSFCNENEAPLFYTWLKNSVQWAAEVKL